MNKDHDHFKDGDTIGLRLRHDGEQFLPLLEDEPKADLSVPSDDRLEAMADRLLRVAATDEVYSWDAIDYPTREGIVEMLRKGVGTILSGGAWQVTDPPLVFTWMDNLQAVCISIDINWFALRPGANGHLHPVAVGAEEVQA